MTNYEGKMAKIIMVVPRSAIFTENIYFQGFITNGAYNIQKHILDNYEYMVRGSAEVNFNYKQPIPYSVIINKEDKEVLAYRRETDINKSAEHRLHGKWSIGVGGHIEEDDHSPNPVLKSASREVSEETGIDIKEKDLLPIGYINDDSEPVGRVHIGAVYVGYIDHKRAHIADGELSKISFLKLSDLEEMEKDKAVEFENWTKILLPYIKELLK